MNRIMTYHLLMFVVLVATCPVAFGQSLKPVPRSVNPARSSLSNGFQDRLTATRLVRAEESDLQLPEESALPAPSAADLERRREEKQRRFRQIIDRLRVLQDQLEKAKEKERQASPLSDTSPETAEQTSQSVEPDSNSDNGSRSVASGLQQHHASSRQTPERPAEELPARSASGQPDQTSDQPTGSDNTAGNGFLDGIDLSSDVLVDGPVDRVALADNLYRVKEYKLALEIYAQIDVRQLSDDQQFWVQFQTASCHRRLGDLPAAREQFRIIAGQPESGWMGRSSTWWLNTMRDRAELEEQLSSMQELISMKKEAFDDVKSEP